MIAMPRPLAATVFGLAVLVAFLISLRWVVQPLLRLLLAFRYRLVVVGREHVPPTGPVLIAANHVTWLDGLFLAAACPRRGHALVNAAYIDWPVLGRWARWIGLIPVPFSGPKAQRAMFQACRKLLDDGEALGIFPEGQMTRNGLTGPFHRGLEVIIAGNDKVVVVPAFLGNLWGSQFSFAGGRFFGKPLRGRRRTVVLVFGPPVPPPATAFAVRQAVLEAGVRAAERIPESHRPLETVDPNLPRVDHPALGPLTGSTADFDRDGVRQAGHKPGSVGQPLPGVALKVVSTSGACLPPDSPGRLLALVAGRSGWVDTGEFASIDREGFVRIVSSHRVEGSQAGWESGGSG
jgi:1-acyl-sn-glycerol-3-phosphate acyltransferase